eukprot:scaffold23368_cov71-Skeletonema_dohrnii-CCMP3373.AAC.5
MQKYIRPQEYVTSPRNARKIDKDRIVSPEVPFVAYEKIPFKTKQQSSQMNDRGQSDNDLLRRSIINVATDLNAIEVQLRESGWRHATEVNCPWILYQCKRTSNTPASRLIPVCGVGCREVGSSNKFKFPDNRDDTPRRLTTLQQPALKQRSHEPGKPETH